MRPQLLYVYSREHNYENIIEASNPPDNFFLVEATDKISRYND